MSITPTDFFDPTARTSRARLAVAVELMRELSLYSDPNELSRVFTKRMNQLYPTARQITLSRRGMEAPRYRVTRFSQWETGNAPPRKPNELPVLAGGVFGELMADDQPRVIDDLTVPAHDPAAPYLAGQRSLVAIPVFDGGKPATVVVLTREEPAAFPREQIPELVWLTNLFGRSIRTLELSDRLREAYDAADYELRTIAEFQQNLLPVHEPSVAGLDVAVHYRTAHRAGGDYYDFFSLPNGQLGVLVADVSGHGTSAAVLMSITHTLAHALPTPPLHPGDFLAYLNVQLAKRYTLSSGNFITAVYAVFDPKNGKLTFANAGHTAPRGRVNGSNRFVPLDQTRRLPLGVTHRSLGPYPEQVVNLRPGDTVALFTDGITEAANGAGEHFGLERLDRVLARRTECAACTVSDVVDELERFTGSSDGDDDRTLVLVGVTELEGKKVAKRAAAVTA
jgi:sigma-B regulation protein RsbU (phosphoserine phosphatase)